MPSFAEIQHEISNILDIAEDQLDEEQREQWQLYFDELATQESSKVDSYGQFKRLEKARAEALKAEAKRLSAKADAILRNLDRTDDYFLHVMMNQGLKRVRGDKYSISIRNSDIVEILDMDAIPEDYLKVTTNVSPDKIAIKAALKEGREIPGTTLAKSSSLIVA